jgi:hypothetical protein
MAFFCQESGVRIVAPGVSKDIDKANGMPVYDGSDAAIAAELSATRTLKGLRQNDAEAGPSPDAIKASREAALTEFTKPAGAKPQASGKDK